MQSGLKVFYNLKSPITQPNNKHHLLMTEIYCTSLNDLGHEY